MPSKKTGRAKTLSEIQARLSAIVETAVDAIIVADEQGTIQSVNSAFTRMFDYTAEEALGRNLSVLMPAPYAEEHDGYIAAYLTTGQKKIMGIGREIVAMRRSGEVFPIDLAVSEIKVGKGRLFTGIIRDITERKEAEDDGKKAVVKEQARTQLALEDVENWLTYAIQQIDADAKKESAGIGGVVVGDGVPVDMPDVPEADALLRRRAKKRGEPVEKRKKKKKKKDDSKEDL